jgi:hypothetical protein
MTPKRRVGAQVGKRRAADLVRADLDARWPAVEFDTRAERDSHGVVVSWCRTAWAPSQDEVLAQAQDTLRPIGRPGPEGSGYAVRAASFVSMESYVAALLVAQQAGSIKVGRRPSDTAVQFPRDPETFAPEDLTRTELDSIQAVCALADVTAEMYLASMARGRGYVRTNLAIAVHRYSDVIATAVT